MSVSTSLSAHSRKLLLQASSARPPASLEAQSLEIPRGGFGSFDANVVMVLSVLLCAVVFSLGLNAILKFAFRFSSLLARDGTGLPSARLVHTGVRQKALKTFPTVEFSKDAKLPSLDAECVICLSEFEPGDRLRLLPKCFHGFHVQCIDKWLSSHTSCPKCRNCLTETCRKIVGCAEAATSSGPPQPPPGPAESNVVAIAPLEREALVCNYRES